MDLLRPLLRALGRSFAQVVVGIYLVFDSLLGPIFGPMMRWLSRLRLIQRIERAIASLPAYAVLGLLAVPFAAEELAKVYSLVLMGGGHFKIGFAIYVAAHIFAILICERIFSAGKEKLLTIAWFAKLFRWLEGYKDRLLDWVKSTDLYRLGLVWRRDLKARAHQLALSTRKTFGR